MHPRNWAFLAVALLLACAAEAKNACRADAAFEQLLDHGVVGPFADFNVMLKTFGLKSYLKKLAGGKALLIPTNHETQRFLRQDVGIRYFVPFVGQVNKPGLPVDISDVQINVLKQAIKKLFVIERAAFRLRIFSDDCHLLAGIYHVHEGINALVSGGRPLRIPGTPFSEDTPDRRRGVRRLLDEGANRRKLLQTSGSDPSSVNLGCGYNIFIAMPITTSGSGVDPGILSDPIFALGATDYTVEQMSGCVNSLASISTYSYTGFQSSLSASLGLSASYKNDSFSASDAFTSSNQATDSNTAYTYSSGTQINTNQYELSPIETLTLSQNFVETVANIYDAVNSGVDSGSLTTYMSTFLQDYGTHFVNTAIAGAIANVFLQTSAVNQATLTQSGNSFSANAQASYGLVSGSISPGFASSSANQVVNDCSSGTTKTQLVPSSVPVPFYTNGSGMIDCTAWTQNLESQALVSNQWATILDDTSLTPIVSIFAFPSLNWPSGWTADGLTNVSNALTNFYAECGAGGTTAQCIAVPTTCNPGSFGSDGMCQNCYTAGDICYIPGTASCNPTSGACNCANLGANLGSGAPWSGTNCGTQEPGSCWSQYSASRGSHCVQNGFCNYGFQGQVSDCDGDVFGCTCWCAPLGGSYDTTDTSGRSSCNRGGGPNGDCPGQECACPPNC